MRGRVTYRYEQPPRHFWVTVEPLSEPTLAAIEKALGRRLDVPEQDAAARVVESAKFFLNRERMRTSAADRRATLAALVKEPDATVLAALAACDVTSRAQVVGAAFVHGQGAAQLTQPEGIREAARSALEHFDDRRGPRGTYLSNLAIDALDLWSRIGGANCSASVNPGTEYAAPLVKFTVALFAAAGARRSASAVAKLLQAAGERGK